MKIDSYEIGLGHSFYPSMWGIMIVKEDRLLFIPLALIAIVTLVIVVMASALWAPVG